MMPTIRIDQEIYDYLNEKGNTADTFSDVLRRELGLEQKTSPKRLLRRTLFQIPKGDRPHVSGALRQAMDRNLPVHWSSTPAREAQIAEVVEYVLAMPENLSVDDREIAARKRVAESRGIDPNSVLDKYGRQLYGDGSGQIRKFRAALQKIEQNLKNEGYV